MGNANKVPDANSRNAHWILDKILNVNSLDLAISLVVAQTATISSVMKSV